MPGANINRTLEKTEVLGSLVDVSVKDHNCFFHAYALYLLSNNLPLPDDLFVSQGSATGGTESRAEQLKKVFSSKDELDKLKRLDTDATDKKMLFEKTIVLGALLRPWFANELNKMEFGQKKERVMEALTKYREISQIPLETVDSPGVSFEPDSFMRDSEEGALFEADPAFFKKYASIEPSDEEIDAMHRKYVDHLAKPLTMVSPQDVKSVLVQQAVHFQMYSQKDGSLSTEITPPLEVADKPVFQIALDVVDREHYYLVGDKGDQPEFKEYLESLAAYVDDTKKYEDIYKLGETAVLTAAPNEVPLANMQDQVLTEKEQAVFNKLAENIPETMPGDSYKKTLKDLIIEHRIEGTTASGIKPNEIDKAEAKTNEAGEREEDKDFAKRLQDAEFEAVDLNPKRSGPG